MFLKVRFFVAVLAYALTKLRKSIQQAEFLLLERHREFREASEASLIFSWAKNTGYGANPREKPEPLFL